MKIVSKLAMSLFAVALMVGFSGKALAADSAKGTVEVTVTGMDGKPAANIEVRIVPPQAKKAAAIPDNSQIVPVAAGAKVEPVAKGTTDDKGVATIKDVPAGEYTVVAGSKDAGMGRENVNVKGGETAKVSLTLKARKPKA